MGSLAEEVYHPPNGAPPGWKDSTYATSLAQQIRPQGWSVLNLGKHPHNLFGDDKTHEEYPGVWPAIEALFAASKAFFAQSDDLKAKYVTNTKDVSEEGFSAIQGEKEFITLRRNSDKYCPEVLKDAVENAWTSVLEVLNEGLKGVEKELGFPTAALTRFSEPCLKMDDNPRATMLRLFRYENDEAKVVAEPHMDLGLFSLVIGDTPGLEAWQSVKGQQPDAGFWNPIEQNFERGCATLMSGRQLQYLTRDRYMPGGHRVLSYGEETPLIPDNLDDLYPSRSKKLLNRLSFAKKKSPMKEKYRYSIVFVLRAHEAVPVDYEALEQPGFTFDEQDKEARTAGELFKRIRKAHYNINIGLKEREEQKKTLNLGSSTPQLLLTEGTSNGH